MSENIRQKIAGIKGQLDAALTHIEKLPTSDDYPNPKRCISNSKLLLETLDEFFRETKAEYLPYAIKTRIAQRVGEVETPLKLIAAAQTSEEIPDNAKKTVSALDLLYAECLQYGLITFGFDEKKAIQQFNLLTAMFEEAKQKAAAALIQLNNDFEAKRQVLVALNEQITPNAEQILTKAAQCTTNANNAQTALTAIQKAADDIKAVRTQVDESAKHVPEEIKALKSSAEESLAATKASEKLSLEASATVKATLAQATDQAAALKLQLDSITAFYGEIEKHRAKMLETQKDGDAKYAALKQESDEKVAEFSKRSDEIVKQNETLLAQIANHLRKAVGISLFHSFDSRRGHLFVSSMIWAGILTLSTLSAIAFAIWFVSSLHQIDTPLIFARLTVAIPVTFLIVFAAKQFSAERRAEEEYAFKSAISVSLDSYRELLDKMKKDGSHDTEFVQKLLHEIFDNPVKRLHNQANPKEMASADPETGKKDIQKILIRSFEKNIEKVDLDKLMELVTSMGTKAG